MAENIGKLNAAIYRNMQSIFNYKLKDVSIRSGQHDFFLVISLNEGISQKKLSEILYVGKSTTAKVVKNLMSNDYIYKEKDIHDKRLEHLYLTEKGKQISALINDTFQEGVAIATKGISGQDVEQTLAVLKRILTNLAEEKEKLSSEPDLSEDLL
ncbi:DNA-binding transcriptional regulator, MarR family [Anaerocolumna jejuensis DSM 15929]|uniref:DNA-binding transcriptional regulator, MarR family n=1 Tax=Anaerocolumna jejuensis DSM 15929 TaxID=1121322 RepID=A0A1M6S525_9FIRM|nr:MarR family winged helix-turn-helix transcriptional regulator [Anaerocolumna jejuensis]SHK39805.1 DNA-binding transcriptional regulator, MarR family [Anaerocolumna jejuensis DSM 15929]